jgi:hypothetical protein
MPTSQRDGKTFVDPSAQALALEARCRWIVIDMGVIARDLADRSGVVLSDKIGCLQDGSTIAQTGWPNFSCARNVLNDSAFVTNYGRQRSFDHLIRPQQKGFGDRKPEPLCRLNIDHQFEANGLFHWKLARLRAPEDLVDKRR